MSGYMKKLKRFLAEEFSFILACPAFLWQLFFLYIPLILLLAYSVTEVSPTTGRLTLSFENYRNLFALAYVKIMFNSFVVASSTALLCLVIAYPVAYLLAFKFRKQWRTFFLFLLILPSWTSLIVQIYAWFFLLSRDGLISRFLYSIGLPQSVHLLNNYGAILIGMVAVYLPFMILPLYTTLDKIDKKVFEASADLGARHLQTFQRIIWPLSLPGVYAGLLLVFLPAFGEFVVPTLLGGSRQMFWGNVIVNKFLMSRDWRAGAAFSSIGLLLPSLVVFFIYLRPMLMQAINKTLKGGEDVFD